MDINIAMKDEVIPLVYDYGCVSGKCTNKYRSFLSVNSLDVTEEVSSLVD